MAPKAAKGKEPVARVAHPSILDNTFPVFTDAAVAAPDNSQEKYEDASGLVLPPETQPYLDTWKRPEELVLNMPNVPMLSLKPAQPLDQPQETKKEKALKGAPPPPASREIEGRMFPGHKSFEWMYHVFVSVMSASKRLAPGEFLWELIYPKDKDGTLMRTPSGRYRVKLFVMDSWRIVTVDDRIPVDLFGQFLLVGARPLQLWPLLLCKALLKVIAAQRITGMSLPHQAAVFQMLTGWPSEDLMDPLSGTQLLGGFMFDRIEDVAKGADKVPGARANVVTACIVKRALPERPPPRLIVFTGPSAVGRSRVMQKLAAEFPDKFALTVSHTTRRPLEHEADGVDYHFVDKAKFIAEAAAGKFLEQAAVSTQRGTYMYGSSYATVREVAATGRLCIMGLDVQGVRALQSNKRIDGLYLYVSPPSMEVLEERTRNRLKEADSTITKRLEWASAEMETADKTELYDHIVDNGDFHEVYYQVKEAISTLSPIIRNRLRGLPAYVLDYSDLIPPNLVEKPFLKPVIISGPTTGERKALMELLVKEFPDVFAIPVKTTTRQLNEDDLYRVTEAEMAMKGGPLGKGSRASSPARVSAANADGLPGTAKVSSGGDGGSGGAQDADTPDGEIYPQDSAVSGPEFDELSKRTKPDPDRLIEHHTDLFTHPLVQRQHGVSHEAIKKVIKSGRLPLLELESGGVNMLKQQEIDCLSIFLRPASVEEYKERLRVWLTESEEVIQQRMRRAEAEQELAESGTAYDHTVINDDLDDCYEQVKALVSRYRPDIIIPEAERLAAEAAAAAAAGPAKDQQPILVLNGPAGAGREVLVAALVAQFPDKFGVPPCITDRKPGKGEAPTASLSFVSAKDLAKLNADGQIAVQRVVDGANVAITKEAVNAIASKGMVVVLDAPDAAALSAFRGAPALKGALYVFVASGGILGNAEAAAEAVAQSELSEDPFDDTLTNTNEVDLVAAVRLALSRHVPEIIPPPYRPLVVGGPFGTGKRVLLQRLFEALPGKFVAPVATTTRPPEVPADEDRPEMHVVEYDVAAEAAANGEFLFHTEAMGHIYGVLRASVKKAQATGKLCVIEVDHVKDLEALRQEGFDATFLYLGLDSEEELLERVRGEILRNPPLGYEPDEATQLFFRQALQEIEEARGKSQPLRASTLNGEDSEGGAAEPVAEAAGEVSLAAGLGVAEGAEGEEVQEGEEGEGQEGEPEAEPGPQRLVDEWVNNGSDAEAAFSRLAEAVYLHYPDVVPKYFVWGYGRALWDKPVRQYGERALRVMVLGPAGVGKTTQCEKLAERFKIPHINVGDLIYEEVKAKTPLGLEAKVFMDASKTVPDHFFITLLKRRLLETQCKSSGWLLDGFPHTAQQTKELYDLGIIPDKVIFMDATHELLLDRTVWRRMDYDTMKTYYVPDQGATALSTPIKPLDKDGKLDMEIMSRLQPRHDDSIENVQARLQLADLHQPHLRAAYEDVSLRVPGAGGPEEAFQRIEAFLTLESVVTDIEVVESHKLKEIQYEVVDTLRYKRKQLLKLQQDDGKTFWVDIKELSTNAYCVQISQDTNNFPVCHKLRRVDLSSVHKQALLYVKSPEPINILVSLSLGMQSAMDDNPSAGHRIMFLSGPSCSGKSTALRMLLRDYPNKLAHLLPVTARPPRKGERDGAPLWFVEPELLAEDQAEGLVVGSCAHDGATYALRLKDLEEAWSSGRVPLVEGPLALCSALREDSSLSPAADITCVYFTADVGALDTRMREVDLLDENAIQAQLALATEELAAVTADAGEGGSKRVQHVVPTTRSKPLEVYHTVKQVASTLWVPSREPMPCQLLMEDFDWRAPRPGPTRKRLRTIMAGATMLELPRGRHLLRLTANHEYLHSLLFLSKTPFEADEYTKVLPLYEVDPPGLVANTYDGEYAPLPADSAALLFRYNFRLEQRTTLAATLGVSGNDMSACARLVLVDNETGAETTAPLTKLRAMDVEPNGDKGYTMLAVARTPPHPKGVGVAEPGDWALTLTATSAPVGFEPASIARSQVMEGAYTANHKLILGRQMLVPLAPTQLAVVATTQPPLPLKMRLLHAQTGADVVWGKDYPVLLERSGLDGTCSLHNTTIAPGKYILHLELDGPNCPAGFQPDPVTGAVAGGPVKWKVTYLPSTDDKACPITTDDSQQRYFRQMVDSWSRTGSTPPPGAAKPGAAAPKPPAAGKGGAAGAPGGARAVAAAALLEKFKAELAAAAPAAPAPPPPPARTLKDGSSMTLTPQERVTIISAPQPLTASILLQEQQLEERRAAQEAAALAAQDIVKQIPAGLESSKANRGALAARKASEFSEWRNQKQLGVKDAIKHRADAVLGVKAEQEAAAAAEAEAAAAAAAEAAKAAGLPPPSPEPGKGAKGAKATPKKK